MKVPVTTRIEQACDNESSNRYAMSDPWLFVGESKSLLVATDGRIFAAVPVDLDISEADEMSGIVPGAQLPVPVSALPKRKGKARAVKLSENGWTNLQTDATFPAGDSTARYPKVEDIMPAHDESDIVLTIDADYLRQVATAICEVG